MSGSHYNLENIFWGFYESKSKVKGLKVLLPYVLHYLMCFGASYSQFWEKAPLLFITGIGFFQIYVGAFLNITATASIDFPVLYIEPFIFFAILTLDVYKVIASHHIIILYSILAATITIKYLLLMRGLIL